MTVTKPNGHYHQPGKDSLSPLPGPDGGSVFVQTEDLYPANLAEIWAQRAYSLAEPPPVETTSQTFDLLVFMLGKEKYSLAVEHVREIYPLVQITPVPRTPEFVVGVFSARGRLISVVDLRAFFGLPRLSLSDQSKIIVVTLEGAISGQSAVGTVDAVKTSRTSRTVGAVGAIGIEVGLLASEVVEVTTIFEEDLEPALTTQVGNQAQFTQGIAPGMLVVLNLKALLNNKRLIIHEEIV